MLRKYFHQLTKKFKNQKGMNLLEIMIVLAILGTLLALIVPPIMNARNRANIKQTKLAIQQIAQAITSYQIDCNKLPASLDALVKADSECSNWGPDPYLKTIPKDGFGQSFTYEIDNGDYTIKSPGYKGKEITNKDE